MGMNSYEFITNNTSPKFRLLINDMLT